MTRTMHEGSADAVAGARALGLDLDGLTNIEALDALLYEFADPSEVEG